MTEDASSGQREQKGLPRSREPNPPPNDDGVSASGWICSMASHLVEDRTALVGLVFVSLVGTVALVGPTLVPHDPLAAVAPALEGPTLRHPLGTDALGRDVLSRLIVGARLSLGSALLAAALVMTLGILAGAIAGYFGGLLDALIMRIVDAILAFPGLILALAIAGVLEPGLLPVIIGLVTVWWVSYARIIRGMVLSVREREFIEGARALGAGDARIIFRHILPHVMPPMIVLVTLEIGGLILAISALNFLGLGVQPPTPEWGAMLNDGRTHLLSAPRLVLAPGAAITLAVLGFNLLGDGIRDVVDPKLR